MSGHNPHGRLGQPVNSSQWNHLQVPSFVPRQPQLAHMSNERPIRSPLAWHHTSNNSAEALYGYMAAAAAAAAASSSNHKTTPLDINPLLPFNRSASNPMPFGSVDLSISSGTRNSMSPSPRSQISPAASNATPSTSSNCTQIAPHNNQHESNMPSQESLAFIAEMSEQLAALKANSALAANLFARDLQPPPTNFSINSEIAKPPPPNNDTPMELVKESNFNENDSFPAAALPLHQLFSANSPNVPQNLNELSKSLLTLINNSSSSNVPLGASAHYPSTNSDLTKSSASGDDSVDSQACNGDDGITKKTRCRRRKPQKTIRMANDPSTAIVANGRDAIEKNRSHKRTENVSTKPFEDASQTQSMDLSNYSAAHDTFSNGKLTNSIYSAATKPINGFASLNMTRYPDPVNSMALAGNQLKSTFNTDDIVKKVEEIVKCNSKLATNDEPAPTNFSITRNGDDTKEFIGQLSNGSDKNNYSICQPTNAAEARMNGNENGIDLMTTQDTDAKNSKTDIDDQLPLLPNAEIKLPEISLPVANSTPKRNKIDETEIQSEKMYSHIENVTATTTTATTTTTTNGVANDTTQNDSENQNSQTNSNTNNPNDSELSKCTEEGQGTSSTAATASTSPAKRSRKRPAPNGRKRGGSTARRPKKSKAKAKATNNSKNSAKNSAASKNTKNTKSNRNAEKSDIKKSKDDVATAESATKFRGPYIQVQPDGSEYVVNAPITEEVIEKQMKNRKLIGTGASAARSRVTGLHVSTLSIKYDAITTDASWMCIFCKLGPHKYGLGDLFGPFILSVESEEFQESQFDPSEDVFRSHRTNADMVQVKGGMKVVPAKASTSSAATALHNTGNSSCRKKRKFTEPMAVSTVPSIVVPDIFHGMTKVSDTAYEVWVHEDCVVWSSGVYMIGARIVGLDAAVWSCSRHKCSICQQYGAIVTCLERGCKIEAHVPCAKRSQWSLSEENFQPRCNLHAITDTNSAESTDYGRQ